MMVSRVNRRGRAIAQKRALERPPPAACVGIASTASSSAADRIVPLQLHQARHIPTDVRQLRPREMPPLSALGPDGN